MVPILSAIIAGEGKSVNKLRAAALSVSYVIGMAWRTPRPAWLRRAPVQ